MPIPPPTIPPPTINDCFPQDIFYEVFSRLGKTDLKVATEVCKLWNHLGNDEKLWKGNAERMFQNEVCVFSSKWNVELVHNVSVRAGLLVGAEISLEDRTNDLIKKNISQIIKLAQSPEKCYEQFLDLVANGLISLMDLLFDINCPTANFFIGSKDCSGHIKLPWLKGHMNLPEYSFDSTDQAHQEICTKYFKTDLKRDVEISCMKIIQLYFFKALESEEPEVRASALKAFRKVFLDYYHNHINKDNPYGTSYVYLSILRSLMRGYLEASKDLKKAVKDFVKIFPKNHFRNSLARNPRSFKAIRLTSAFSDSNPRMRYRTAAFLNLMVAVYLLSLTQS